MDRRRMLGVALGWGMIAWTPWFALVLVGSFIAAGLDALGTVAGYGVVQRRARDAVRGRVLAAQVTAGLGANMIGFLAVGPLVQARSLPHRNGTAPGRVHGLTRWNPLGSDPRKRPRRSRR